MEKILKELSNNPTDKQLTINAAQKWIAGLKELTTHKTNKDDIDFINEHILVLENLVEMSEK